MNRRRFIKGLSATGLLLPHYMASAGLLTAAGAPRLRVQSGGGGDPSALTTLINSLSAGQNSTALGSTWTPQTAGLMTGDDINWVNNVLYDPVRKWGFAAGKAQNGGDRMDFAFYLESADTWFVENCGFNEDGHVWNCIAYSRKTGKGYLIPGGGRGDTLYQCEFDGVDQVSISVASSSAPSQIGSFMTGGAAGFVNGASAATIHPNFFGTDDEALLLVIHDGLASWNPVTDEWDMVLLWDGGLPAEHPRPACLYSYGLDAVIASSGAANDPTTYHRIDDESTNSEITAPPIALSVDDGANAVGALIDDPSATGGPFVFVKNGSNEIYQFNGSTWPSRGTHPFTGADTNGENWVVAPVYPYGGRQPAFLALENHATGNPTPRVYIPEAA